MESIKATVIRRFLEFLSAYVPLKEARVATLGGRGLEAKLWSDAGIPSGTQGHGWLIERGAARHALITDHRYKVHNQLGTFHRILAGDGKGARIDAFHLDLCGTVTAQVLKDFAPTLPYVLRSAGRCLAVTVADARRNTALEDWPKVMKLASKLWGEDAEKLRMHLVAQQKLMPTPTRKLPAFFKAFDPVKASKREFALMTMLAKLLRRGSWAPTAMQRYVYVSRYQGQPFRMRTYFFHLERHPRKEVGVALVRTWLASPLYFSDGESFVEIKAPPIPVKRTATEKGRKMSRLGDIARTLGGEELAEYEHLLSVEQRLIRLTQELNKAFSAAGMSFMPADPIDTASAQSNPSKPVKRYYESLTEQEAIEWLLKVLELKARQNGQWKNGQQWKDLLKQDFGHYNEALGRSLRAALARTSGKFRKNFAARIKSVLGENAQPYLDRLARL